jgi:hypothetical protein
VRDLFLREVAASAQVRHIQPYAHPDVHPSKGWAGLLSHHRL